MFILPLFSKKICSLNRLLKGLTKKSILLGEYLLTNLLDRGKTTQSLSSSVCPSVLLFCPKLCPSVLLSCLSVVPTFPVNFSTTFCRSTGGRSGRRIKCRCWYKRVSLQMHLVKLKRNLKLKLFYFKKNSELDLRLIKI